MKSIVFLLALSASALPQATTVLFSTAPGDSKGSAYSVGPFPTNVLTTEDASQATGIRVSLPSSNDNCAAQPAAVCSYSGLLNQLDGFSVNPRVLVCFSGPVDTASLKNGISIVPVAAPGPHSIAADRVVYDPATNCAYAKPAHPLLQDTSYLLLISNQITAGGHPVQADPQFQPCATGAGGEYCSQLSSALAHAPKPPNIVGASLFTTMSVTSWLQQAQSVTASLPGVNLPAGLPSSLELSAIQKLTYYPAQSGLGPQDIPLSVLSGVDSVSFGIFLSPNYLNTSGDAAGTITTSPANPNGFSEVSYHVFMPPASRGKKIPVVIYAHGSGDTQFGAPTYLASTLAKNGIALLAFELPGHGFGPSSSVSATLALGVTVTESTPGRGVQLAPGSPLASESGCVVPGPIGVRDCVRQSAVDVFSLVNLIRTTNGLGLNLDPKRLYVLGQSLGSLVCSVSLPVDPTLRAGILNGDGGTSVDIARLSPSARQLAEAFLASVPNPLLLNTAAGIAPPEPIFNDAFNDNYIFSALPPQAYSVPYAPNLQAAFEAADWLGMLADPVSFGPYLSTSPLRGVSKKRALFQFGISDSEVPNPTETAAVVAADAQQSTWILNFPATVSLQPELATLEDPAIPGFPILPHRILANPTIYTPGNEAELSLALALQKQVAGYVQSDGTNIPDPNRFLTNPFSPGQRLFFQSPLPTMLNYLPAQQ